MISFTWIHNHSGLYGTIFSQSDYCIINIYKLIDICNTDAAHAFKQGTIILWTKQWHYSQIKVHV
jgi:hypothetical protein